MLSLPASAATFKRSFLDGDGHLDISSDENVWQVLFDSGGRFTSAVDRVADVRVGASATKPLILGGNRSLKIGVSSGVEAIHQVQLIWPDSQLDPGTTRDLVPRAGQLLLRLALQGKADASAKGSAPAGPLKTTFGVTAGGSVRCERLKIYSDTTTARDILLDAFAGIRLPQQTWTVPEIPADGEVLVCRFGGYLTLNSQVSYGYSVTGSREIEVGKLNLDLGYRLKLMAGLSAACRLAGEFDLEARAGSRPSFVRYVVRKSRESESNFAVDFGLDAGTHLKGLPDSSDEFLVKVFGAGVERAIDLFSRARSYSNLAALEAAAGKLLKGALDDLSRRLIGRALADATLSAFVTKMLQVVDVYNTIDARIVHVYEDALDRIPQLARTLDLLAKVTSRDGLKDVSDSEAWALINRLAGPKLYDVLLEDAAFAEFARLVKGAKSFVDDVAMKEVRDVIQTLKTACPLDALLQQLKGVTTPGQLETLADEKLQGLVEQLLNKTFTEIRATNAAVALKDLHDTLERLAVFKEKYYEKAAEIANRSYAAQLHFAFARATFDTALLDVEVDVSAAEGQELARLAAGGDFAGLLARYSSALVRVNRGVLTHAVTSSTHLQVNLFGYGIEGLTRVLQQTDEALEAHDGGLMHIYTTRTQLDERHKHGGELAASSFLVASVARALQPEGSGEYLVRTLPKMSVQYDLLKEDDKTKPDEMRQILELAERLDIVDAAAFTDELRAQFPNGLGKVSAKYVVRYDADAVASAFQIKDGPDRENLKRLAADTMRRFIAAKYTAMPRDHHLALLGFAYAEPRTYELYRTLGADAFVTRHVSVIVPGWYAAGSSATLELAKGHKNDLTVLYAVESRFVERLVKLDATIDKLRDGGSGVSARDLDEQVRQFVEMADDLSFGRENAFFVVFDRLVYEGSGGRLPRTSALVLEITPPGGEKVTKILTGAKPAASA